MRTQPTPEHVRQAFEYLRATAQRGKPWPAKVEDLPRESARYVAVHAVARAMARRAAVAAARQDLQRTPTPSQPPRFDAKRAAANDREDDHAD